MNHLRMGTRVFIGVLFAAMVLFTGTAQAGPIMFDQALGGPGWYNGSGNPNGGFTVRSSNGVEIAMRVKGRQNPNVIHSPDGIYNVPLGSQPGVPNRTFWSFEWGIYLDPQYGWDLDEVFPYTKLTVSDLTAGKSMTVDFPYWCDNSYWSGTAKTVGSLGNGCGATLLDTHIGAQNSTNPSFGDFPLNLVPGYTFDMNAAHYYRFEITSESFGGRELNDLYIDVPAGDAPNPNTNVPEPSSALLFGAGLAGYLTRRHRRNKRGKK